MIKVLVFRKNKEIHAFKITGHANSGPYGYDLVCAGVSAVSFGAVNAAMELGNAEFIINQADDGGYFYVEIPSDLSGENAKQVQLIFEAMIISLQTIEREYRQFIQIIDKLGGTFIC